MKDVLFVNGRDVGKDFGLVVRRIEGLGAVWSSETTSEPLIGRVGDLRDVGHIAMSSKPLTIRGSFKADSVTALRTAVREFFRWVRVNELHEIETALHPGKVVYARLLEPDIEWADPQALSWVTEEGSLTFKLHSPLLYDRNYQVYGGASGTRIMPLLGNFSSTPELWLSLTSGSVNPTVSLYRANGSLIKSVTLTQLIGGTDYLWHLSDDMMVKSVMAGTIADAPNIAPSGDPFFILDPADGDPVNGLYPYFVSSNCYLQVAVRRVDTV